MILFLGDKSSQLTEFITFWFLWVRSWKACRRKNSVFKNLRVFLPYISLIPSHYENNVESWPAIKGSYVKKNEPLVMSTMTLSESPHSSASSISVIWRVIPLFRSCLWDGPCLLRHGVVSSCYLQPPNPITLT